MEPASSGPFEPASSAGQEPTPFSAPQPARGTAQPDSAPVNSQANMEEIPFMDKWMELGAKPYFWEDEHVMVREVRYPISQRHGHYAFAGLYETIAAWERAGFEHPCQHPGDQWRTCCFSIRRRRGCTAGRETRSFCSGTAEWTARASSSGSIFWPLLIRKQRSTALFGGFADGYPPCDVQREVI